MPLAWLSIKCFVALMVSAVFSNSASKLSAKDLAAEVVGDPDNSDMVTLPEQSWLSSSSILEASEVRAVLMDFAAVTVGLTVGTGRADGTTTDAFDASCFVLRLEEVVADDVREDDIFQEFVQPVC